MTSRGEATMPNQWRLPFVSRMWFLPFLLAGCEGGTNEDPGLPSAVTIRVSLSSSGEQANRDCGTLSSVIMGISRDGRIVVFSSTASNLVSGVSNAKRQIFARDVDAGSTVVASATAAGVIADKDCDDPSISKDGRYVVFESSATLLASTTDGRKHIYRKDLQTGSLVLVDQSSGGLEGGTTGTDQSMRASISADGQYIVFRSNMTNLVIPATTSPRQHIFRRFIPPSGPASTVLISSPHGGTAEGGSTGGTTCLDPWVSDDGDRVAFSSSFSDLAAADTDSTNDVYVRIHSTSTTELVSRATGSGGAKGTGESVEPRISGNGRHVVFRSAATNLVVGDSNPNVDVFRRDLTDKVTIRVSVNSSGTQTTQVLNPLGNIVGDCSFSSISDDGRYISFGCWAGNLVSDDTNNTFDVFLRDVDAGKTTRISVRTLGAQGDAESFVNAISGDGRYVAFLALASNLVEQDTNGNIDAFRRGPLY